MVPKSIPMHGPSPLLLESAAPPRIEARRVTDSEAVRLAENLDDFCRPNSEAADKAHWHASAVTTRDLLPMTMQKSLLLMKEQ